MLKTLGTKSAEPRNGGVGFGGESRAGRVRSKIDDKKKIDNGEVDGGKFEDDEVGEKV